jgi:transcriptional regulator with XRE-family HTH domain
MSRPKNITPYPVLALRNALGLSQQQFAVQNGWSASVVQKWEQGNPPSESNFQKLKEIARKHHLSELAGLTSAPSRRAPKKTPTEPDSQPESGNPQQWHDLLDQILNGGDADEIQAVQSNLRVFGRYAARKPQVRRRTAPENIGEKTT